MSPPCTQGRLLTFCLPVLSILFLCGCSGAGAGAGATRVGALPYRRIAVVEFYDGSQYSSYGYGGDLSRALVEKLSDRTESADFVLLPQAALRARETPFVSGKLPLGILVQARKEYLADAAIVGSLNEIDPYRMPSAQISLKLVDTSTGEVLVSLSEGWDAGDGGVHKRLEDYCRRNCGSGDCKYGTDMFLNSPRYFLRFVADQVAEKVVVSL